MIGFDLDDVRAFIEGLEQIVNTNELEDVMRYSHFRAIVEFRIIENKMMQDAEMCV